jgi:PST family polysaccharide transporter
MPLYQALFPNISKKSPEEIFFLIKKITIPIAILGFLITLTIVLLAKNILNFVYDDELISSYYYILQIVGLIAFFSSLNMLFVTLYFPAIKKYKIRVKILVSSGIFHLFLVVILTNFFSIIGVAISASITEFIILIYAYILYNKQKK